MPKPFDLQKALAGKPVLGPDGKPLRRLILVPEMASELKVLAILHGGSCCWFDEHGTSKYTNAPLTMADPPKKKIDGWVNIYKSDTIVGYRSSGHLYKSDEEARNAAMNHCDVIAQAFVTFEVEDEA